jgi:hypothetical protein
VDAVKWLTDKAEDELVAAVSPGVSLAERASRNTARS